MYKRIICCVFLIVRLELGFSQDEGPIVKTPVGFVMGRYVTSYEGRTVSAFEGIPYAQPPVGDLRFKEPQPVEPWSDLLAANNTYVCLQYTAIVPTHVALGTEDCLYLYIYVPRYSITGNEDLDVVVNIHGGAFVTGDPLSSGPDYIMDRDLVYVSMNYRLGILGFLSTGDGVVPGNNGLKDQVMALKWVKENIQYFGGNPNSITLVGASSGASCVHFHYLSPMSKGLFNRGFSQSGTALNNWALTKDPLSNAQKLGQQLECSTSSSEELVQCLRKLPGEQITVALEKFFLFANLFPTTPFGPVVEKGENAFLSDHPRKLLEQGKINDYPWITSNVKDEGMVPVGFFISFGYLQELNERMDELLPVALDYYNSANNETVAKITKEIKDYYLGSDTVSEDNILYLVKLFSDRLFVNDAFKAIRLHANASESPVYFYYFDYILDIPVPIKGNLPVVAHGDDTKMLYRQAQDPRILSSSDTKMKEVFLDFLYYFATTGKPKLRGLAWEPVSAVEEGINFMHISSPDIIFRQNTTETRSAKFWESLPLKENEDLF